MFVDDTLKALQELARWHRSMTIVDSKPLTVIALTGTNGKTTTKELIREVLSVKYSVTNIISVLFLKSAVFLPANLKSIGYFHIILIQILFEHCPWLCFRTHVPYSRS